MKRREQDLSDRSHCFPAEPAEGKRGNCVTKLQTVERALKILLQLLHSAGAAVAVVDKLLNAALTNRNQAVLREDEETVDRYASQQLSKPEQVGGRTYDSPPNIAPPRRAASSGERGLVALNLILAGHTDSFGARSKHFDLLE